MENNFLTTATQLARLLEKRILDEKSSSHEIKESLNSLLSYLYSGISDQFDESNILPTKKYIEKELTDIKEKDEIAYQHVIDFIETKNKNHTAATEISLNNIIGSWGFYEPEQHGERYALWAGTQPSFSLTIENNIKNNAICFIFSDYLCRGVNFSTDLSIKLNGVSKYFSIYPIAEGNYSQMIMIVNHDIDEEIIEVEFFTASAVSPQEKENLSDTRTLSICIQRLIIVSTEQEQK